MKNKQKPLGILAFSIFITSNALWLLSNEEDRSSDESVFLYLSIVAMKNILLDQSTLLSAYFNTLTFRPPLISLQAIPWLYIGLAPLTAALVSQSIWLLVIYMSCKSYLKDRFPPLLAFSLLSLTPYFTAQVREFHTDLGCAALTLATYISFFFLRDANTSRNQIASTIFTGALIGLGMLMRPDFIINILPLILLTIFLYYKKDFDTSKRAILALTFSLLLFIPWYVKNWNSFTSWFAGNAVIGSMSAYEIFISRLQILSFFMLGSVLSISPLLPKYVKGIRERFKSNWTSGDFLIISGLLIIGIHLLIDISLPTRTRMLMSASALIVIGMISATIYTNVEILLTLLVSTILSGYLSFFYTPNLTWRNIGIVNAIPHKANYKSQHNDVLAACRMEKFKSKGEKIRFLVQPYGLFTYESLLLASSSEDSIAISTDLFTPSNIQFDYSIYDCYLRPISPQHDKNRAYQYKALFDYLQKNKAATPTKIFTDHEGNMMGFFIK